MFGIGMPELLVILAVALIVLGPKRLPEVAKGLGKALNEFRRATSSISDELESARAMLEEEERRLRQPPAAAKKENADMTGSRFERSGLAGTGQPSSPESDTPPSDEPASDGPSGSPSDETLKTS